MIDHVSIGVVDLERACDFYEQVLATAGLLKLIEKPGTVGFGKKYPEFWLNHRPALALRNLHDGGHVCLRARSREAVDEFYDRALRMGADSYGGPGFRAQYSDAYYAAFIVDADNNRVEMVCFIAD